MDIKDLYQEIILDHGKRPRNKREMPGATHSAEGYNPMCGDQIKVWLMVVDGLVKDASFSGQGCAISQASASMMTQALIGQTVEHAEELFTVFRGSVMGEGDGEVCDHSTPFDLSSTTEIEELGELNCLTGVRQYPNRIKCATLAWPAMHSALAIPIGEATSS